ncbi:MAG: hypothetical protein NT049_09135 [Planctomycetota bacterium]|nr:hypothetical protein [Planctomycetota bacterium]
MIYKGPAVEGNACSKRRKPPSGCQDCQTPIFPGFREAPLPAEFRAPLAHAAWKSQLSPSRRWLVEAMQRLGFGSIEGLAILNGEPSPVPPPRLYRIQRLTGLNDDRVEARLEDFQLKDQVLRLFGAFDRIGNGVVQAIEVRDGLPYSLMMEESRRT